MLSSYYFLSCIALRISYIWWQFWGEWGKTIRKRVTKFWEAATCEDLNRPEFSFILIWCKLYGLETTGLISGFPRSHNLWQEVSWLNYHILMSPIMKLVNILLLHIGVDFMLNFDFYVFSFIYIRSWFIEHFQFCKYAKNTTFKKFLSNHCL